MGLRDLMKQYEEDMRISNNIKHFRLEKKMTQKELGEKIGGISQQQIGRWENGAKPKLETIQKIADALDVPITYLLSLEDLDKYHQEEIRHAEKHTHSTYAIIKILEELYKRAEIINVDAYNNDELQYSSDYISLGIEPNRISISNTNFEKICEQLKQVLKSSIDLIAENENDMMKNWINEEDIDELQTAELEHVIIKAKDNHQNKKYTKSEKAL